jgi:hypothetical protein
MHPGSNAGKLNKHKRGELTVQRESDTFILLGDGRADHTPPPRLWCAGMGKGCALIRNVYKEYCSATVVMPVKGTNIISGKVRSQKENDANLNSRNSKCSSERQNKAVSESV